MREDLSGLSQQPSGPKPKQPGEPLDLVAMAEDLKGAGKPAPVSPPGAGIPTAAAPPLSPRARVPVGAPSRFPELQPRYDRFGEPMNEAARDIETARGGVAADTSSTAERARRFGQGAVLSMGLPFTPLTPEEARAPATQAAATRYGPAAVGRVQQLAAQPGAPPGERRSFLRSLYEASPLTAVPGLLEREPEAYGGLAGTVLQAELLRPGPGVGVARGTQAPGVGDAFRTLGLDPRTATAQDVQAAYVDAVKRTHPDIAPGDRVARGGSADPLVAAQQFARATQAKEAALASLGRERPAQEFRQPGTEETQYRAQRAKAQPPTPSEVSAPPAPSSTGASIVTPPPGRGADALRTLTDEQLAAEHPLGATPPVGASAAAPGAQEAQVTRAMGRAVKRERATGGPRSESLIQPQPPERPVVPTSSEAGTRTPLAGAGIPLSPQLAGGVQPSGSPGRNLPPETAPETPRTLGAVGPPPPAVPGPPPPSRLEVAGPASGSAPGSVPEPPRARSAPSRTSRGAEPVPPVSALSIGGKPPSAQDTPILDRSLAAVPHDAAIRFTARPGDPQGAAKEALAMKVAATGRDFAAVAVMRQRGATNAELAAHLGERGVTGATSVPLMREMFRIPHPGGEPTTEMPTAVEAGAPHDQAAVQEGLFGEKTLAGKEQAELMPETAGQRAPALKQQKMGPEEVARVKREGAEPKGERPLELAKQPGTEKRLARHAELSAQIARDEQVMGAGTSTSVFTDVGAHIGQPGQKFTRTKRTGPAYAAAGRLAQARKRLAALEKTMTPEELQQARTAAEPAMGEVAQQTSEKIAQKGKTSPELEREGIQQESEPDYERLARMSSSKLGPKLRAATIDRMIDYGETREELEKLPDRELINKALESGRLPENEQSKLLDVVFGMGETGAVRIPAHALPTPVTRRTGTVDKFLKLYSPQSRGPEVAQAAESFLREYGEMVRRNDVTNARLKKYRGKVDLSQASGVEFMDRAERGLGQVSPDLQAVADIVRQEYDLRRDLVQQAEPGTLENWIENYMGRVWQHGRQAPTALQDAARLLAARRPLAGSKGFLKPRTYDYYVDGVAAGKVPVTFDGIDMAKLKLREHDRFVMATRWRRDLTARNLRAFYKSDELAPEGWVKEPEGEVWYRNERGERVRSGSHYVPEPIAQLEHNVLGPGIEGPFSNVLNAWRTLNNSLTSAILGWSGFHGYMSTMTSAFSRAALGWNKVAGGDPLGVGDILAGQTVVPAVTRNLLHGAALRAAWKNPTIVNPAMQHLAQLLAHAGGGFEMPREYQAATIAGIKEAIAQGKLPTTVGRAVALAFRAGSIPILEHYVPLIKYGAWADGARAWLKEHPTATDEETDKALQELRYQIDNRFGQVRYDTRFWNQTLKQVLQAAFFAPGWVAGSVEMVTNAMRDAAGGRFRSHAVMGLLAMVTTMATINALYQLAATGEGPKDLQDVIEPRDGTSDEFGNPNRVSPATYFKVYAAWFRAAKHLLKGQRGGGLGPVPSGLVPAFNMVQEMWTNRDYSGRMIRNPEDPAGKQFQQVAKYLVGEWVPLSARNVREAQRRGETGLRAFQPVAGFTPASREAIRTPAQNMIFDILRSHTPARTPEELERSQAKRAAGPQVTGDRRLLELFRHLSPDDRARVYEVTNEHERILFGPYVAPHMKPYRK